MNESKPFYRRIRSFVRREGRLTKGQQRALDELFPRYGVPFTPQLLDLDELFGRRAPRILEIGFGNGGALAQLAQDHPENDYFGIEVHRPGVGNLLLQIEQHDLSNVRVSQHDAVEVLEDQIPDHSLDAVYLFFPDPWHKKKHHKRRIVQPAFTQLLRRKLKPGGLFHMATDWEDYAGHAQAVMEQAEGFENTAGVGHYAKRPDYRPLTRFEQRGQRLGHGVWDLIYKKVD
ncbi:tRNA (guanosine(46)-N7)-methyltransferase TrmB [Thiohalophilus sp.]|uniref:tRNA (guanosine(46)-N7)-methyltransferase TrmB n=1 Tax=Thiohalophilus sp. TaxID=3028392 RepID=UPI002ACDAEE5|nr:tRNA (guanosine(46)-N7)-methyltransferase TrmB [Thiohalophilus sp.]MDZ7661714.1 tRNA (guanosine(46)-N7)-methyltransferase TrmB [Thiohalophilus sp.]